MAFDVVIDPGHGGATNAGRSTAYGARGPAGALEKDVTLRLAKAVAARLGQRATLTRGDDRNLSLGHRAAIARDAGAKVFLSIHTNAGSNEPRGPETWVHSSGSAASSSLANRVQRELARLGGRSRGVRRGDMAVLSPQHHARGTAACLVEVDFLDHPEGERRLSTPAGVDAIARALAAAVQGHLRESGGRFGRATQGDEIHDPLVAQYRRDNGLSPDDPPSDGEIKYSADYADWLAFRSRFRVVGGTPAAANEVTQGQLDDLMQAWGCMNSGTGMSLHGSSSDLSTFRGMLRDALVASRSLRTRFVAMACDSAHSVRYEIGMGATSATAASPALLRTVFFDAFEFDAAAASLAAARRVRRVHTFDIRDIGACPRPGSGGAEVPTQAERLAHGLAEAYHAANSANTGTTQADFSARYAVAHVEGIRAENEVRADLGFTKTRRLSGGDARTATTLDRDYVDGAGNVTVMHFDVGWPQSNVTGVHR